MNRSKSLVSAYEASSALPPHPDVLKLGRNPPDTDEIEIDVPEGLTYCCPCPEHWTNKVSLAYKSYNLAVRDEAGERFTEATRDCSVFVNGISPSRAIGDSTLMLCKTGVVYETHDYTVLGMRIEAYGVDLQRLNEINSSFGLPVNVQTNVASAQTLLLRTDVRLPDGNVHLAFEGDGPKMQLWLWNYERDSCSLLLDSEDRPSLDIPISRWRRLVASATYDRVTEVRLLAFSEGSRKLVFGYSLETSERVPQCLCIEVGVRFPSRREEVLHHTFARQYVRLFCEQDHRLELVQFGVPMRLIAKDLKFQYTEDFVVFVVVGQGVMWYTAIK